jgi:hypothetical protein
LELSVIKDIFPGNTSIDVTTIQRRHSIDGLSHHNNCITILYGNHVSDNRQLHLVIPSCSAKLWYSGLRCLIRGMQLQKNHTDKRIYWLMDQYLQLFYEQEKCQGPTPAEAIKVSYTPFNEHHLCRKMNVFVFRMSRVQCVMLLLNWMINEPRPSFLRQVITLQHHHLPRALDTPSHLSYSRSDYSHLHIIKKHPICLTSF